MLCFDLIFWRKMMTRSLCARPGGEVLARSCSVKSPDRNLVPRGERMHSHLLACGMDSRAPALFPSQVDKCDPSAMAPGVAKLLAWVTATVLLAGTPGYARATEPIRIAPDLDQAEVYFKTVNDLASDDGNDDKKPRKALSTYLKGSRGKEIEKCARKCTSTCIRGGQGAPGLGPLSVRKELVVFKSGYRSGSYCLSECVQICALELGQK